MYVRRFITRLKEKVRNIRNSQPSDEMISVEELEDVEALWLKEVQRPMTEENKFDQQKVSIGVYADAFFSVLTEIQSVLNSKQLTYICMNMKSKSL